MSPWPQVAMPAAQISMLLGGSIAFRHPHSLKRQTRPLTYTHPLVVTCATDISTDGFGRATVPVMAHGSSPGPGITMAPGGCTSPSYPPIPYHLQVSSSTSFHRAQTSGFCFLSHLSTPYYLFSISQSLILSSKWCLPWSPGQGLGCLLLFGDYLFLVSS